MRRVASAVDSLTVRELCTALEATVETLFPDEIWVRGAISGISRRTNGHVYFDLVDPDAEGADRPVIPVALFANNKFRVNAILKKAGGAVKMTDGIEIRIRGRLAYWPRQSRIQLLMSLIDPAFTLGRLEADRERILAALRADDLLDAQRRLAAPVLPLRIALVTSVGSAAHADFLEEIGASRHPFDVEAIDARVQGDDAVDTLCAAIERANNLGVDVVAVVRGGGARTDLVAFDDERLARAIAASTVPVVVGVGHETDWSIADEVAHASARTPTACARWCVDRVDDFAHRVDLAASTLAERSLATLERHGHRIDVAASRLTQLATRGLDAADADLRLVLDRIHRAAAERADREAHGLDHVARRLGDLDPATALRRGWSITRLADGRVLTDPAGVTTGARIVTTLAGGDLHSTVVAPAATGTDGAPTEPDGEPT